MKLLDIINLKFKDPDMENEYMSIKKQAFFQDFTIFDGYLIVLNLLLVIPGILRDDMRDFYVGISLIALLLGLLLTRKVFRNYVQYLTLIALFAYNISRLVLMKIGYSSASKTSQFYQGYMFAAIQCIVVNRIGRIDQIIITLALSLGLRLGVIIGAIQADPVDPVSLLRQILIDSFMVFVCYSNEKNGRKAFRNFYQSREELSKFKELLDDSLPQSVIILDCQKLSPLFSNNAFSKTFSRKRDEGTTDPTLTELIDENSEGAKPQISSLRVDPATLREVGSTQSDFHNLVFSEEMPQGREFLLKLLESDILHEKVLSVSANYSTSEQRRSFEIAIKKIKWNTLDAVAVILNETTHQEKLIALKAANLNKDKILATVSHELRTPLHAIIGILKMNEPRIKDPEVLENLTLCKDNAHLLLSLVNSILDLHQISTGKLNLNLSRVEIRRFLAEVLRLFSFQCSQKKIYLQVNIDPNVPQNIVTDGNRLRQIIINLVGNALKFTSSGGIKVDVVQDLERLQISVTDTGVGIKEQDIPKLFKMEGKLEDTQSVNKHGVGLGLTISDALAILLNSSCTQEGAGIAVKSQYKLGSTFSFQILKELAAGNEGSNQEYSLPDISYEELLTPLNLQSKLASYASLIRISSEDKQTILKAQKVNQESLNSLKPQNLSKFYESQPAKLEQDSSDKSWILVVDDNPFNLLVASNLIKSVGYSVKLAQGGREAIELVKEMKEQNETLKVIFMDCQMPIMDGFETTTTLLDLMQKEEIQSAPIFGWTAHNSKEDVQRCFDCGMKGHLAKPTSQDELVRVLSEVNSSSS